MKRIGLYVLGLTAMFNSYAVTLDAPVSVELSSGGVRTYLVEDFNNGGIKDLMVADTDSGKVTVYFGENPKEGLYNDGKTLPTLGIAAYWNPVNFLVSADFDNDGDLDVALGAYMCDGDNHNFPVMLNDGKGKFTTAPCLRRAGGSTYIDTYINFMSTGDVNLDGNEDLVISVTGNYGEKGVYLYLGNGDGTFSDRITVYDAGTSGFRPINMVVGDYTSEGIPDIIVLSGISLTGERENTLFIGDGVGNFTESVYEGNIEFTDEFENDPVTALVRTWSTWHPVDVHIVNDFNGDGLTDVVTLLTEVGKNTTAVLYLQYTGNTPPPAPVKTKEVDPIEVEEVEEIEIEEIEEIEPEEAQE